MFSSRSSVFIRRAAFFAAVSTLVFSSSSPTFVLASSTPAVVSQSDEPLDLSVLDEPNAAPAPTPAASPEPSEPPAASVETPTSSSASNGGEPRSKLLELVLAGGWIGAILLVGSIFAVSLAIRLALSLRRAAFFSAEVEEAVRDALNRDDFAAALAAAEERNDAILGRVLAAGLREADRGWDAVEKGLEDAVAEETAAFYRRTEPLSTLGNVAPMLGLLGTVVGMVSTFGELAVADGSGRNLAGGIYFALITTVDGLLVAIPVLVAHAALNARGAALFAELVQRLDRLFAPTKRLLTSPSAPLAQTVQTPQTPQAAPTSRAAQTAQTPRTASSPVSESPRRSTPVAGLQEVAPTPPSRPTLSLKSKPNAAPPR